MNRTFFLIFGTGCGWLSFRIFKGMTITNWTDFIFEPTTFLTGMTCFTLSFLCLSVFVRRIMSSMLFSDDTKRWRELLVNVSVLSCSFIFLFAIYRMQVLALLIFSILYGMISLDLNRERVRRRG
ncbi:hypothetical protein [Bacillus solimangrovi]|uniref:Uncharacterized protein n=1 Tax=Bacillus solimangrovi TaxID=1305675 RepID=A0A1E5LHD7_9BACI|nr:hypothetical protein [Bacillus solimangrovi]OEH93487.1 hypothetical protein BFG57_00385 [Bacillus solimangrovi]